MKTTTVYRCRIDRRTFYWTLAHLVVYSLMGIGLYYLYEGGYFSAWFTSFIAAAIALMALSIPRKIVVTEENLEIHCLLDRTELPRAEIKAVRKTDARRMKWMIPLFGGCGFFGYYGYYFDLRRFERVRIYASAWRNFVEIEDIYDDLLFVSSPDPDRLVAELTPQRDGNPANEKGGEEAAKSPSDADDPKWEQTELFAE